MVNLTDCKTAQEALDKFARSVGCADIPGSLIFHKNEITGIDFKLGEAVLKWRKPKKEE
jgi:hypothetical protein